jgi:hypothetical protein
MRLVDVIAGTHSIFHGCRDELVTAWDEFVSTA